MTNIYLMDVRDCFAPLAMTRQEKGNRERGALPPLELPSVVRTASFRPPSSLFLPSPFAKKERG
jgi:hypothetical protein